MSTLAESKLTYTEAQAEAYALLERIAGKDLECGDVWANDVVQQILLAFEYPRGFEEDEQVALVTRTAPPKTPASMTAGELVGAATAGGKWEVGGPYPDVSIIHCVDGGTDIEPPIYEPVAFLGGGTAHLQAAIDAELIVRAVGAFGALVAAVEELQKHAEWMGCPRGYGMSDFAATFEAARKALALANGGGL